MGDSARVPMIGWLQGKVADPWQAPPRCGVLLICGGVGYEIQLGRRQWEALPPAGSELGLHIHHSVREDAWTLFGFPRREERELFRELVGVSGVGPQMALGLLGEIETGELVRAIVQADLRRLAQAPGVGKRTAERLAVDLRVKLQGRYAGAAAISAEVMAPVTRAGRRCRPLWRPWATKRWRCTGPCGPWPPPAWRPTPPSTTGSATACAGWRAPPPEGREPHALGSPFDR